MFSISFMIMSSYIQYLLQIFNHPVPDKVAGGMNDSIWGAFFLYSTSFFFNLYKPGFPKSIKFVFSGPLKKQSTFHLLKVYGNPTKFNTLCAIITYVYQTDKTSFSSLKTYYIKNYSERVLILIYYLESSA